MTIPTRSYKLLLLYLFLIAVHSRSEGKLYWSMVETEHMHVLLAGPIGLRGFDCNCQVRVYQTLATLGYKIFPCSCRYNIDQRRSLRFWPMSVHSLNGKRISEQIHVNQISQSNKSFIPFFVTAIGSRCQFDNSMQREFNIWEILLRKVMEIGISVPNKAVNQLKK